MQEVEFRVLGPFEVLVEGRALELKRRKQRSLLALLMLRAGEVVSKDRLIEELWAGNPPKAAVGSLQNLVSELRKLLGPDSIRTREPGYVLDVDPDRIDLHRFERLIAQAAEGGDAQRRSSLLRAALALWRGAPLADFTFEAFADVEVARLEELRTTARQELVDAELELGRHSQVIGELETLVAENPLRERLRAQLMLALYRAGRQAEALEAYRQARETLVGELGIEPSPDLQRLEQSILRHDPELGLAEEQPQALPRTLEERRKTVTVLFTDIVDFASLSGALDPEVLRSIMRRYFDTVRTIVERHGGAVDKFIGDQAIAVFGIPQMHEDDALRAVRSANDLSAALVALNADLERDHRLGLQIRTGITTGEVLVGNAASGEPFATGPALSEAMRLQQSALPGETLIAESTRALLREAVALEPVEQIEAGELGSIRAFRLLSLGDSSGLRPQANLPFIGRQHELAALRHAFEAARAERRSRVVTVLGEAGIGKTRLVTEFVSSLQSDATALFGRCVSYGEGATYLPLAEIVRQIAPVRPQATISALLEGDEHAALIADRIAELAGRGEGAAPTGELFWAVRRFFEALARKRPLIAVFEDIHWAEPTLLDLIEYLDTWKSDAPVLVICITRPELLDKRPGWRTTTEAIPVEPLSSDESKTLLAELAAGAELSDRTRARILEVAEGNALFVEQLLAHMTEDVGPEGLDDAVPPSIETLLASRLDTLDPEDRAALERAAVVGKHFLRSAVLHLSPPETAAMLDNRLVALERRGLIHARRAPGTAEDEFHFHHVLIRDTAYAGITKERRADLHERHGSWLEHRTEPDELIGYHAEQAHRYRRELSAGDPELLRLASWAGEHLAAAGIRAWKRADTPAAVNLLGRGSALLPREDSRRTELLCELGVAQRWSGDYEGAERTLGEAIEESGRATDRRIQLRARLELAHARLFGEKEGRSDELLVLAEEAIPIFEELGDERALGRTWRHVGYVRGGIKGQLSEWQDASERALAHYRRSGWSPAGCLAELGSALLHGPMPVPEAIVRCQQLLGEATDRAGQANMLCYMGGLEALAGELDEARRMVAEASAIYKEIDEVYALANNSGRVLGRIEMLSGNPSAAERSFRECCSIFEQVRDEPGLATVAAELADALYAQARYDEAAGWVDLAEKRAAGDDINAQFTWRRVRAKLLARDAVFDDAEALGLQAAALAARTDALSDHGYVLLDLSEVLRSSQREREAARQVRAALTLFARKGNIVSAEVARSLLAELTVA